MTTPEDRVRAARQARARLVPLTRYGEDAVWRPASAAVDAFDDLLAEVERLRGLIDSPELHDFARGVVLEAAHQRGRWGAGHDAGKAPEDWFWLLGYLGGKALHAAKTGDVEKALHHTISTAAALANWHAALTGASTDMRPGIDPQERGYEHS